MSLPNPGASEPLRAAQYVRMSTDRQKYSTQNQMAAIAEYAARKNMTIVRTYADEGRSGLLLDRRLALKELISDVLLGHADFETVLVYDVSRWGRFQDSDESAHYEFICKEAGVKVEYCAEEFLNDGSLISNVMKSLKRAMAGEYSRELSNKVFAAQCRLITLGFRQGGSPPYGLRRLLLDQNGKSKGILEFGQRKHLQSDRVILKPGPQHEIEIVREIFRQFVFEQKSESRIARELNQEGILNSTGRPWTHQTVRFVLSNENYIGTNIYNRVTCRLGQKARGNSPNLWIRAPGVFEPIIDPEIFSTAQKVHKVSRIILSDREMLARLASLLREKGRLSATLIDEAEFLPDNGTYIRRFGSLRRAYKLIEYRPRTNFRYIDRDVFMATEIKKVANGLTDLVQKAGGSAVFDRTSETITIDGTIRVCIYVARSAHIPGGGIMWRLRRRLSLRGEWIIALRPDFHYRSIMGYLLIPVAGFPKLYAEYSNRNPARLAACSFGSVEAMFPKIMSPPDQLYVPLTPHSSTRFGAAKLDPLPGKRRTSLRRLRKNECSQVPQG
jgi:DNA invertase Pin-like site-specific DNA recombinase